MDPRTDKSRAGFHQELLAATISRRQKLDGAAFDEAELNTEQIGYLAAKSSLKFDTTLQGARKKAAQVEAMRILCAMLGKNPSLALAFKTRGIEVVIVSADRPMTALPEFASLGGVGISQAGVSGASRGWDETRGLGGLAVGNKLYVAVTEENLVGGAVGPIVSQVGGACYAPQYSTTTHEFAHGLHTGVLDARQRQIITTMYEKRTGGLTIQEHQGEPYLFYDGTVQELEKLLKKEWADGCLLKMHPSASKSYPVYGKNRQWRYSYTSTFRPTNCYVAIDEREYFAQCVNAYLGANGGTDPYTGRARHNGAVWIRSNEPQQMVGLLDELFSPHGVSVEPFSGFGQALLESTNTAQTGPTRKYLTVGELIAKRKLAKKNAAAGGVRSRVSFFENLGQPGRK